MLLTKKRYIHADQPMQGPLTFAYRGTFGQHAARPDSCDRGAHLAAHWSIELHCLHLGIILVVSAEGNLLGYLAVVHKAVPPVPLHLNEHTKWPNVPHCCPVYAAWLWRIIFQVGGMLSCGPAAVISPGVPFPGAPGVVSPWAAPRNQAFGASPRVQRHGCCSGHCRIKNILNIQASGSQI